MKKLFLLFSLICCLPSWGANKMKPWFNDKNLILTGVYYYPEHWKESEWERDF